MSKENNDENVRWIKNPDVPHFGKPKGAYSMIIQALKLTHVHGETYVDKEGNRFVLTKYGLQPAVQINVKEKIRSLEYELGVVKSERDEAVDKLGVVKSERDEAVDKLKGARHRAEEERIRQKTANKNLNLQIQKLQKKNKDLRLALEEKINK